jgi:hypothetical protein
LFEPIPRVDAEAFLDDLLARLPALSFEEEMALRIPPGAARLADASGRYEGRMPTIIPAEIAPEPGWAEPEITSYIDAVETLGMICLLCDTIYCVPSGIWSRA